MAAWTLTGELAPIGALLDRVEGAADPAVESKDWVRYPNPAGRPRDLAMLFRGLPEAEVAAYEAVNRLSIPAPYRALLVQLNGGHIWDLSLHGLPNTMRVEPPRLDRAGEMPRDFASGADDGTARPLDSPWICFGTGPSLDGRGVRYLIDAGGSVRAEVGGEVLDDWPSIGAMLGDELPRAEAAWPATVGSYPAASSIGWGERLRLTLEDLWDALVSKVLDGLVRLLPKADPATCEHAWEVLGVLTRDRAIEVVCFACRTHGAVRDASEAEWQRALRAGEEEVPWEEGERVEWPSPPGAG